MVRILEILIVLQRVAVCCSVLQCVTAGRVPQSRGTFREGEIARDSQCFAVGCSMLQCVAVCCGVLYCVAVCCTVLQRAAMCCSVLQCDAV